jgi:DNA-binding response OmpR family regulator
MPHMDAPNTHARRDAPDGEAAEIIILCAEEEVRDVLAYWLGTPAMKAQVAADGYQAARLLQNGGRWLVTDRVLPPWPGLDTFLNLRSQYPEAQIAFIESGNIHDGILARVTGASAVLARPLSRHTLIDVLSGGR